MHLLPVGIIFIPTRFHDFSDQSLLFARVLFEVPTDDVNVAWTYHITPGGLGTLLSVTDNILKETKDLWFDKKSPIHVEYMNNDFVTLYPYHYGGTDTSILIELLKTEKDIEVRIKKM